MRAITYSRLGSAVDVLELQDLPTPEPGAREVLVRLKTSAVNPSDVKVRSGARPGVTEPAYPVIIPHSDGAGVIEAVGESVPTERIGERVWIWNGQWQRAFGTAAEYIALPQEQAVRLPDTVSYAEGAVLGIPGLTACRAVLGGGPVDGLSVLVSGGAGTVGHLAIQVAKASGARVFATARGQGGIAAAKTAGAEAVFDYSSPDLAKDILAANDGTGIDRIVEVEFGKNIHMDTEIIAENGTIAAYGSALDMTPVIPFGPLMFKAANIDLILVYMLTEIERTETIAQLTGLLERDALKFRIFRSFDLSECAEAHACIEAGGRAGSVVLNI